MSNKGKMALMSVVLLIVAGLLIALFAEYKD